MCVFLVVICKQEKALQCEIERVFFFLFLTVICKLYRERPCDVDVR